MTESNPNISIIVPVYNVEKYLVRCLDSIFNQEFSGSFEVIAVEDASTDNSLQKLKTYQEKETRLIIIEHEVNKKVSFARATGLKASKGDYIMFVDSDDWLLPNALETLYTKCVDCEADVVVFNHFRDNNNGERSNVNRIRKTLITTDKLIVQQYFFGALWNKIIKRTITEDLICGKVELSMTEDFLYGTEILIRANNICIIPDIFYVYFENKNSLSWLVRSEQYLQNQVVVLSQIQKIFLEYNVGLEFSNKALNYFEKWIYLELAKIHFWNKDKLVICDNLVRELFQFPIMTGSRITRLRTSLRYKYINLLEVTIRFGLKLTLGIIRRSFKK